MSHVKKLFVYFLYFNGAADRTKSSDSDFTGHWAAVFAVLCCLYYRKYASSTDYISVCQKSFRMGCRFFTFCLEKGEKGGKKLQEKAGKGLFLALLLFVGIPVPGTGAWTGTLAASILDMDFKSSVAAVMLGVLLAGIIMGVASVTAIGIFT